jgi:hypothetical protein
MPVFGYEETQFLLTNTVVKLEVYVHLLLGTVRV